MDREGQKGSTPFLKYLLRFRRDPSCWVVVGTLVGYYGSLSPNEMEGCEGERMGSPVEPCIATL